MKVKKKPKRTKARVQASKKRLAHIGTAITVAILVAIIAVSSLLVYSFLNSTTDQTTKSDQNNNQPSKPKAAIVDHLSLTYPNQTFVQKATNILKQAGYKVDYYPGEEASVESYRDLPTHDYALIILRVHSSATVLQGTQIVEAPVILFTSERVSKTKYVYEQLTGQLVSIAYSLEEGERGILYFGISPLFVSQVMKGRFENTIVIMMGCQGLDNTLMAEAFVQMGAKVYISWDQWVSASHTDQATIQLLKHLLTEKQTIERAVTETMKEVGPDPADNSILRYYPLEAGAYAVES